MCADMCVPQYRGCGSQLSFQHGSWDQEAVMLHSRYLNPNSWLLASTILLQWTYSSHIHHVYGSFLNLRPCLADTGLFWAPTHKCGMTLEGYLYFIKCSYTPSAQSPTGQGSPAWRSHLFTIYHVLPNITTGDFQISNKLSILECSMSLPNSSYHCLMLPWESSWHHHTGGQS